MRPYGSLLGLFLSALALAFIPMNASAAAPEAASAQTRQLTAWVIETHDNQGLPFVIIDKIKAHALAFDKQGQFVEAAPVLLGLGHGDVSPPGIGERPLKDIPPKDRITPSGRFRAALGKNIAGSDVLWVDYNTAISLHRVIRGAAVDRRLHRLATPTADDNRISYGCINVPITFYEEVVRALFAATGGIVYILPETRSIKDVFFAGKHQALHSPLL